MTTLRCAILLFTFILGLTKVNTQWGVDDDGCRTPDRGVGTCTNIYRCQPILDLLTSAPKPLSPEIRNLLVRYQCGLDVNTVKVCCPSGPIVTTNAPPTPTGRPPVTDNLNTLPDVTNHKNINLLRTACGILQTDDKVLNGNKTALFEFPWMVLISYRIGNGVDFRCGGTLINDRYVLTAAHCITNLGRLILAGVRLGEYDIGQQNDCETPPEGDQSCADPVQDMTIEEVIPHPQYNITSFSNDIGLLRLGRKANIATDSVKPICLPITPEIRDLKAAKVIVTGWGQTENASKSNVLLKIDIPIMPQDQCQKSYDKIATITSNHICAGGRNNQDSCAGDSGGPMQVVGAVENEARYIQYGVVSFGPKPCGLIGRPGVYTKIAAYLDWILDSMKP